MMPVWVFLGGGTGAVLRWLLTPLAPAPWGTVLVNVLGSALLAALVHPATGLPEPWRTAVATGVMGGFTTYSTFNLEVFAAWQAGDLGLAALTAGVTLGGCLLGAWAGWSLASALGS